MDSPDREQSKTPTLDEVPIRLVVWDKSDKFPKARNVFTNRGAPLSLRNDRWLQKICGEDTHAFFDVWTELVGDWNPARLHDIEAPTTKTTTSVLLRLPNVTCVGLGQELQLLEQAQGNGDHPTMRVFDLSRNNAPGKPIKVVAWSEDSAADPKMYKVSLGPGRRFVLFLEPVILQECTGQNTVPSVTETFEYWNVLCDRWSATNVTEAITVLSGIRTLLVRHRANRRAVGLGYYIATLEDDRARSVAWTQRHNDAPVAGPSEEPAAKRVRREGRVEIVNPANIVPPRVHAGPAPGRLAANSARAAPQRAEIIDLCD